MARPVDADSAITYDKIIHAAVEELDQSTPTTSVSLKRVAQRAGLSVGTLQYYFGSKEALLEACLDGYYERLSALGDELFRSLAESSDRTTHERIERAVRRFVRFVREERALIRLRVATNGLRGELHPDRQDEFLGTIILRGAQALAPLVDLDELELRLTIEILSVSIIRLAHMSVAEQRCLMGAADEAADAALEAYFVRAATRLLAL